ncbi:MAG: hypothetical protein M9887_07185 [Chitinophagales bacterium]|nr:hypothetical protein [Chitinophagales bacterium]
MKAACKYLCLCVTALFGLLTVSNAQDIGMDLRHLNNLRKITFTTDSNAFLLDTVGIIPNTFILKYVEKETAISKSSYKLKPFTGEIVLLDSLLYGQKLEAVYRAFPTKIKTVYKKKTFPGYSWRDSTYLDPYFYDPNYTLKEDLIDFGGLDYSGAFARGISFGNSQDLSVNSTLDLQLSGNIGDIEILAALTDNNIPIQPDGTTSQIQDLDKVYIQVKKGKHQLVAGDYDISIRNDYFVKFSKQLQGASFKTGFDFKKGWTTEHTASFAVAKGKFARNELNGTEGNQGPYKLMGNNNESQIIILAGSERVYADGKLLSRGEDHDYVIDYNTGEVVFTPSFLVTKDKRLVVEFEYSEKNYFRSLWYTAHEVNYKGLKLYAQFYSEQDSKNKPILADIDSTSESILKNIGNDIQKAIVPSARPVEYSANEVQYTLKDTLANGINYDSIFVYTAEKDVDLYKLRFSYVGEGNGHYQPDKNTLNQRVYSWVAPINGVLQGAYEPVELMITPKKDQYAVLGVRYEINPQTKIRSEFAYSNRDPNTFSKIDNHENKGWALFNEINRVDSIGKKKWLMKTKASYELKNKGFQAPEQYRSVEFSRDWNVVGNEKVNEHFVNAAVEIDNQEAGLRMNADWSLYNRQKIQTGNRYQYNVNYQKDNWILSADINWLKSKDKTFNSSFFRPNIDVERVFPKLKGFAVNTGFSSEYNAMKDNVTDTLLSSAYYNNNFYAGIKTSDTLLLSAELKYKLRKDYSPLQEQFHEASMGQDFSLNVKANRLKNQDLRLDFTYRDLKVKNTLSSGLESDKNFLGRVEYGFRIKRGAVRFNTIYELGSGQERVREFTYLEVASGQGLYRWIDENGDGVQQLDEFVIAEFSDSANYVRVLTNVNEYIQARVVTYNQTLQLNPKAVWFNEAGIKKFIARLSLNSTILITRKTFKGVQLSPFNPFILNTDDENVLSLNSSFRNSIYFNQGNPKFYMNYTWFITQSKNILVNGFDTRNKQEQILEANYNISKSFSTNLKLLKGGQLVNAEYSDNNNFDLSVYQINPSFTWVHQTSLRASIGYVYDRKQNVPELGDELAKGNRFNFNFRYSQASKQSVETKFSFVLFEYNGKSGTTKSYQILDGLNQGKNFIWNADYMRVLSNNLQLNISYEGRKTGDKGKVIHTGMATLRAVF